MTEFDERERLRDRAIRPDPDGRLALDRQMREVVDIQGLGVPPNLGLEEAPSDRPLCPKLLRRAWPRAANRIPGRDLSIATAS